MLKRELIYDKRLVGRMIKRGILSQVEYDQYLESLPDVVDKSEPLSPEPEDGEERQQPES